VRFDETAQFYKVVYNETSDDIDYMEHHLTQIIDEDKNHTVHHLYDKYSNAINWVYTDL